MHAQEDEKMIKLWREDIVALLQGTSELFADHLSRVFPSLLKSKGTCPSTRGTCESLQSSCEAPLLYE
jgi:hypothetical protein